MEQSEEIYCLKWNQFQINIFAALENLHLSEDFADVTLYCDGSSLKAHKVILSACSPYFKTVFMEHPLCSHPVIILKGVSGEDLNSLITFMYQGEVNIQRERLPEFMRTAKLLQVRGLTTSTNPPPKPSAHQKAKKHSYEDSSDSDSSVQGKKRVRIRRRSTDSTLSSSVAHPPATTETLSDVAPESLPEIVNNNKTNNADKSSDIPTSQKSEQQNAEDSSDKIESTPSQLELSTVTIKQEIITDDFCENITEFDAEGSILHRSLKGDHTVKPAESLVVTPDLPLAMNPVKAEPLLCLNNSTLHSRNAKAYTQTRKTPERHTNQDRTPTDTFEEKLSNTLQVLKNNPQISVSREQGEHFQITLKDPKTCNSGKSKSHLVEIQPQISIEPMRHVEESDKKRAYASNSSILAQNLTKISSPKVFGGSGASRNMSGERIGSGKSTETNSPSDSHSSSALVHILGQPHGSGSVVPPGAQAWNCPHCQQLYHNQSALKYHVRLVHSDFNNRLCCYLCPNSFTMRESYKAHMLELHGIRH